MKNIREDFGVFILTHKRAKRVYTYKSLRKAGYTGDIYMVVDNTDDQIDNYKENFGEDKVLIFDKYKTAKEIDTADIFDNMSCIVFARNAVYNLAKLVGKRYILVLDDDYTAFVMRFTRERDYKPSKTMIKSLNEYIKIYLDFFIEAKLDCLAFAQSGDYLGGANSTMARLFKEGKMHRKAMNAFFLDVENPIEYKGRLNEDVNSYLYYGYRGYKIFTYPRISLVQMRTQQQDGGMTDAYTNFGTYLKSYYSILYHPSAVTIRKMGAVYYRLHHNIKWDRVAPCILDEKYKKI